MPDPANAIDVVFFDIGGTLLDRDEATGDLTAFPSSVGLLRAVRAMGCRVGIITTLGGSMSDDDARALLKTFQLDSFIDPDGLISEHDAGAAKPDPQIYQFAARRVGVAIDRCLFVGESLIEVLGARVAGMRAILKPCPPGRDLPG